MVCGQKKLPGFLPVHGKPGPESVVRCYRFLGVLEAHLLLVTSSLPTKTGLALCAGQKNSQSVSVKGVGKWQIPLLPSLREIPHIH